MQAVGEGLVDEPAARESVTLHDIEQGIEVNGFEAGAVQHGKVDAGAALACKDVLGQAHALSCLIARRRRGIGDVLLLQGGVYRTHLHFHDVGVAVLITREGR